MQFNGIRVGEVSQIELRRRRSAPRRSADRDHRQRADQADTKAPLGNAGADRRGGDRADRRRARRRRRWSAQNGKPPVLVAETSELQNILQAAQTISAKADVLIAHRQAASATTAPAVGDTVHNVDTFSKALSDNSAGVNSALARHRRSRQEDRAAVRPAADAVRRSRPAWSRRSIRTRCGAIVGDVQTVTDQLADNKAAIASTLTDAAALAKRLNDTAGKLDSALATSTRWSSRSTPPRSPISSTAPTRSA